MFICLQLYWFCVLRYIFLLLAMSGNKLSKENTSKDFHFLPSIQWHAEDWAKRTDFISANLELVARATEFFLLLPHKKVVARGRQKENLRELHSSTWQLLSLAQVHPAYHSRPCRQTQSLAEVDGRTELQVNTDLHNTGLAYKHKWKFHHFIKRLCVCLYFCLIARPML